MNNKEQYLGQRNDGVEFPFSSLDTNQQYDLYVQEDEVIPVEGFPSLDTYQQHLFSPDMPQSEINQADIIYQNQLNSELPIKTQLTEQIQKIDKELLVIQKRINNLSSLKKHYQQQLNNLN